MAGDGVTTNQTIENVLMNDPEVKVDGGKMKKIQEESLAGTRLV